jgi:hypothetical protein
MRRVLRYSPSQLRKMSKSELIEHIENRTATIGKRSVDAWNARNDAVNRIHVDLSPLNQESLVFIANSFNSKN